MTFPNPRLAPGVHFFERDNSLLQIGSNPNSAIVIDKEIGRKIIPLLNGDNSIDQICIKLQSFEIDYGSTKTFLSQLEQLGLVVPGPTTQTYNNKNPVSEIQRLNLHRETIGNHQAINNRITCEIAIHGLGRLGTILCLLLASSGYPNITVHDSKLVREDDLTPWGASRVDIGNRRDHVARSLMERMIRGVSAHKNSLRYQASRRVEILLPDQRADFPWIDATSADAFAAKNISYLFAATSTSNALISSVITPGENPCLRCLYLHKCDQDPAWPKIDLQIGICSTLDTAPIALIMRTALQIQGVLNDWIDEIAGVTEGIPNQTSGQSAMTQLVCSKPQTLKIVQPELDESTSTTRESFDETYPTYFHPSCGCRMDLTG